MSYKINFSGEEVDNLLETVRLGSNIISPISADVDTFKKNLTEPYKFVPRLSISSQEIPCTVERSLPDGNIYSIVLSAFRESEGVLYKHECGIEGGSLIGERSTQLTTPIRRVKDLSKLGPIELTAYIYATLGKVSSDRTISIKRNDSDIFEEFFVEYEISGGRIIWPDDIVWANRMAPTSNNGSTYQVHIVGNLGTFIEFPRPIIEFTIDTTTVNGEQGMTWEEWLDSSYNTVDAVYLDGVILIDDQTIVLNDTPIVPTETIVKNGNYGLISSASPEEKLIGTYNQSATSTGGATLGTAYLPTIAMNSGGNLTMSSLFGNSSSGPVANATYNDAAKTLTVLKGWTHPMFGPVDSDIVFNVDFNNMTLTAQSDISVGGWATITGYKLTKQQ